MKKTLLATALLTGMMSSAAFADTNFYIGAGVGQAEVDFQEIAGTSVQDDSDTSWKIYGGYNFNQHFAVELAYTDLGESDVTILGQDTDIDADVLSIALVGKYPVSEQIDVFGKLGYADIDADADVAGVGSTSVSESDVLYGLGVDYAVTEQVDIRLEWERMDFEDEVDNVTLGVSFNF